jgi:hypothetical protein
MYNLGLYILNRYDLYVQKYTNFKRSQETMNLQIVINPKSNEMILGLHQKGNLKCCKTR